MSPKSPIGAINLSLDNIVETMAEQWNSKEMINNKHIDLRVEKYSNLEEC
jgi:hypothetical protein